MSNILKQIEISLKEILSDIASTYNLNKDELINKYLPDTVDKGKKIKKSKENDTNVVIEKKKRGRKKKEKDEIIKTYEYEYQNNKYLVDENNNVYTFDLEHPVFVGEKLIDGTIRFKQ